jgi:hypothetical protein
MHHEIGLEGLARVSDAREIRMVARDLSRQLWRV